MTPAAFFIQMRQRVWTDTRRNMFQFRWFFMFLDVETTDQRKNAEKREREKKPIRCYGKLIIHSSKKRIWQMRAHESEVMEKAMEMRAENKMQVKNII